MRHNEARLKLQQGYLDAALGAAEQGYADSEKKGDLLWSQRFRLLRAEALTRMGKGSEALSLLTAEPPAGLPFDISARRKILQAQAFCQAGSFHEAQLRLDEALQVLPESSQTGLPAEAALVSGKCALSQGQLQKSQDAFRRAEKLSEHRDEFIRASALGNLGVLFQRTGNCAEAVNVFQTLLTLARSIHSPILEEKTLGSLGACYAELGDWKQSLRFSQQAADIAAEIKNLADRQNWLINLGRAHFALWELPEAEKAYSNALAIAQERKDPLGSAACFNNLSRLSLRQGDIGKSEGYVQQGKLLKVAAEDVHFAIDSAEIIAAREQFAKAEGLFQELVSHTENDPLLYFLVQRDLGRVYWHEKKNGLADQTFRQAIATAEKALARLKRPENRMSFMDQMPFYDTYIQFLVAQHQPEAALRVAERSRAQVLAAALENTSKTPRRQVSIRAVQKLARRRRQTILAYSMTDEKTFLWVITSSQIKLLELPGHPELFPQVDAFNREIQDHRNLEDSPAAAQLYGTLIRPAEDLIPRGTSVVIIPSKLLSVVNFEALVVPGQHPHYWIEDVDIEIADSLALLAKAVPKNGSFLKNDKKLLVMGAPVEATTEFPVLKHAPEEMQKIQPRFPREKVTTIAGKDAVPQAYRASNPGQYRFIHLDTHGVASEMNPLESFIVLSPGPDGNYKLYAQEIKDIPLHAELVDISACYGAGTRWYQGEGIVGLAWAFLHAGAHQVIAALWEVDDASSPQFMDDFYGELTQGKSAAEALRDAKLKMLHSSDFHRHPYYWASLQLYTGS